MKNYLNMVWCSDLTVLWKILLYRHTVFDLREVNMNWGGRRGMKMIPVWACSCLASTLEKYGLKIWMKILNIWPLYILDRKFNIELTLDLGGSLSVSWKNIYRMDKPQYYWIGMENMSLRQKKKSNFWFFQIFNFVAGTKFYSVLHHKFEVRIPTKSIFFRHLIKSLSADIINMQN